MLHSTHLLQNLRTLAFSVVLVALITAIKMVATPLGVELPFILYFGVVFSAAWLRGRWGGLSTLALAAGVANYFLPAPHQVFLLTSANLLQTAVFLLEGLIIIEVVQAARSTQNQLRELQTLATALANAHTPQEVARVALSRGAAVLGAHGGMVVRKRGDGDLEVLAAEIPKSVEQPLLHDLESLPAGDRPAQGRAHLGLSPTYFTLPCVRGPGRGPLRGRRGIPFGRQ